MGQTRKTKHIVKKNKTKKEAFTIGLKPFEEEFSKNIPNASLIKTNTAKKKELVKELMTKFAPHSIKPHDNFYDYINYTWIKNVALKEQQKYIVQVDDLSAFQC